MTNVLIAGYYGAGNLGDEAILDCMLKDLGQAIPAFVPTVVSIDLASTVRQHAVRAVGYQDIPALIEAARSSDLIVLGGGGLFHDYWEVDPGTILTRDQSGLAYYVGILVLARLVGVPSMIYAVGVGPLRTDQSKELTTLAFELADAATVRDRTSLSLVQSLPGLSESARAGLVCSMDPALLLEPAVPSAIREALSTAGLPPGSPYLTCCLRPWTAPGVPEDWRMQVARALDRTVEETGRAVVFIGLDKGQPGSESDQEVAASVRGWMRFPERTISIVPADPMLAAGILATASEALCMRYHAVLWSLAAGIPVTALAYDPKVGSLLSDLGLGGQALPPKEWTEQRLQPKLGQAGSAGDATAVPEALEAARAAARLSASLAYATLAKGRQTPPPSEIHLRRLQVQRSLYLDQVIAESGRGQDLLREEIKALRLERAQLLRERDRLDRDLGGLRSTSGVRVLNRYWTIVGTILPEGSRGRFLYRLATGSVRQAKLAIRPAWHATGFEDRVSTSPLARDTIAMADQRQDSAVFHRSPRRDLLQFEDGLRLRNTNTVAIMLSTTPLDLDEGQRSTNLALALSKLGWGIVFAYWRWDRTVWRPQDWLADGILQVPLDYLLSHQDELSETLRNRDCRLHIGFPFPGLFRLVAASHAAGWVSVYDVMDDWGAFHSAGMAPWYDAPFEAHLMRTADAVLAVSHRLRERVAEAAHRKAELLPNAWKEGIELVGERREVARGDLTIGYFGHLTPAWFDWDLLVRSAKRRPAWKFHLVGYGDDGRRASLPPNVITHGRVPQSQLAGYAANWDVAIVPFKPGNIAEAADVIKAYEYLGMGLPVVETGVHPPVGAEHLVLRAGTADDFIQSIELAAESKQRLRQDRKDFAASATWDARAEALIRLIESGGQRVAEKRALFGERS